MIRIRDLHQNAGELEPLGGGKLKTVPGDFGNEFHGGQFNQAAEIWQGASGLEPCGEERVADGIWDGLFGLGFGGVVSRIADEYAERFEPAGSRRNLFRGFAGWFAFRSAGAWA